MKTIIFLLLLTFASCSKKEVEYKIIYSKSSSNFWGKPIQNNQCRYFYVKYSNYQPIEFIEDCDKYSIGDTLHGLTIIKQR